jgi:hypothetical protein
VFDDSPATMAGRRSPFLTGAECRNLTPVSQNGNSRWLKAKVCERPERGLSPLGTHEFELLAWIRVRYVTVR